MADKQFVKGAITGVLCASLVLGGGYAGLQRNGLAGSTVLSDVAVTQKIKYLENLIDQNYLEDVDEDSLKEGIYTGLLYGLGDPYSRYYTEEEYEAHRGWGHSCYLDGCAYAKKYQIPRLYITHHEPGKTDAELRALEQKARKIYPGTRYARMGDVIEL